MQSIRFTPIGKFKVRSQGAVLYKDDDTKPGEILVAYRSPDIPGILYVPRSIAARREFRKKFLEPPK